MKFFFKSLVWLCTLTLLGLLVVSFFAGYKISMSFFIGMLHEEIRREKILLLVTENKFSVLQIILFITSTAIFFLLIKFDKAWEFVLKHLHQFKKSFILIFRDALRSDAQFIFILPFASYIFFAFYLPVAYDEASTYLNFTSRSPLVSMLYYPAPNNHILHSVITSFTKYIPFLGPLQCMRISSVIASALTCFVLFSFIKKYYSVNSAYIITGLSAVLFLYVYYSFASRGYALVNLFFVCCLYSVYKIIFEGRLRHWFYFSVFGVLGFYAMPSFLYPFFTLNLLLLLHNFTGIFRQLLFGLATIIAVAILYIPVIAVNGMGALTGNKQLQSVTRAETASLFPKFVSDSLTEVTGINFWIVALLLFSALLILIIQKKQLEIKLVVAFVIGPLLLMLLHPVIPFARTFTYYCIVLPFLCVIPLSTFLEKLPRKYIIALVILAQIIFLYSFYTKMKLHKSENMKYAEINKHIAGNNSYYLNCKWYDAVLSFELKSRKFDEAIIEYNNPPVRVSADSISGYDYIIIDKIFDETKSLAPLYSDKITNVYKR